MLTNFAALTNEQKTVWSMDFWRQARNHAFVTRFMGKGENSVIQEVTELRKDERGARAVITLVADAEGDGVAGDNTLKGNEEALQSFDRTITLDQLRHAHKNKGRMSEQRSVVRFREQARDKLAYWCGDRIDQLAFLTMSGIAYNYNTDGSLRDSKSQLPLLEFAGQVTAPSAKRHLRWDQGTLDLDDGNTSSIVAADTPTYRMLVLAKAYAKRHFIRGIREKGTSEEFYHVFMSPEGMAKLRLDPDYLANVRNAGVRGKSNELFAGSSSVLVDGMYIHEYRHVFNTTGAANGSKWGAANDVNGQRTLFCGAQALGIADIGNASWDEEPDDYNNQVGISVGKIFGLLKPVFHSNVDKSAQDFGILAIDTAI